MQIYLRSLERYSACTTTAYGDACIDNECNQNNAFPNRTRGMMDEWYILFLDDVIRLPGTNEYNTVETRHAVNIFMKIL